MRYRYVLCIPLTLVLACATDSTSPEPELVFSADEHDFGTVLVGNSSQTLRLILVNRGGVRSGGVTVTLSGPNAADFTIVRDLCTGTQLRSGGTCVVEVQLDPESSGTKSAVITAEGGVNLNVTATLSGIAEDAALRFATGDEVRFGDMAVGTTRVIAVSLRNWAAQATGPLSSAITGSGAAAFSIAEDRCLGRSLMLGQSCEVDIRFAPGAAGTSEASLTVSSAERAAMTRLMGSSGSVTGLPAPPPTDFGIQRTGEYGTHRVVTFTNAGPGTTSGLRTSIGGAHANDFSIHVDSCRGRALAPGESCDLEVRFRPGATGPRTGTLTVFDNLGSGATGSLAGTGGIVTFAVIPRALDFGPRMVGLIPTQATILVQNTGTVRSSEVEGLGDCEEGPWDYGCEPLVRTVNSCGPIEPGASCVLIFRFEPLLVGPFHTTLRVGDLLSHTMMSVTGTGTGLQAVGSLVVPGAVRGTPGATTSVTVTNGANDLTGVLSTTVTNANFEIVTNGCAGSQLAAGQSCAIAIRVAALPVAGTVLGTLVVEAGIGGTARTELTGMVE